MYLTLFCNGFMNCIEKKFTISYLCANESSRLNIDVVCILHKLSMYDQ